MTPASTTEADPPDHAFGRAAPDAARPTTLQRVPGSDWRDVLSETMERAGSQSSFGDLLRAIAGCDAGLTDVAGWLTDEMIMGRVQLSVQDGVVLPVRHYEMAPGARSYRCRISR